MINSGCTHTCIDKELVEKEAIPKVKLPKKITSTNADGTFSQNKPIMDFIKINIDINGHKEDLKALVTSLESAELFIRHDRLTKHNPEID